MPSDPLILGPFQHGVGGPFGSVVGDDHLRPPPPGNDTRQFTHDTDARDRGVLHSRQPIAVPRRIGRTKGSLNSTPHALRGC